MRVLLLICLASLLTTSLVVAACTSSPDTSTSDGQPEAPATAQEPATSTAAPTQPAPDVCEETPRQTEGPFYFDTGEFRRDITEGKPGATLLVSLRLVEAGSCEPIPGAVVDVWHSDAIGHYSGYRGQGAENANTTGETFLRGKQVTDENGNVEFETIYPGWYRGRTVHIHFKAGSDGRSLISSQLYFPDAVTDAVSLAEPYSARSSRRTLNEDDGVLDDDTPTPALLGNVTQNGDGYMVSLTIGVTP